MTDIIIDLYDVDDPEYCERIENCVSYPHIGETILVQKYPFPRFKVVNVIWSHDGNHDFIEVRGSKLK